MAYCKFCGEYFEETEKRGMRRYCSPECRNKANYEKAKHRYKKVCELCKKEFETASKDQKYCSLDCQHDVQSIERKGLQPNGQPLKRYICKHCKEWFTPKASDRITFCSRRCAFNYKTEHRTFKSPSCKVYFYRCEICKKIFTRQRKVNKNANHIICDSEMCRSSLQSLLNHERNRKRYATLCEQKVEGEKINKLKVYIEDNWMCQICGDPVDPELKFPHLFSASLDHIKPISKGGLHTRDNVQLAHLICNSKKNARLLSPIRKRIMQLTFNLGAGA